MAKVRQDAWSHEDDLLLAETVLRHIREGSTQLNAFEEVGDKLNRTAAACGFRWNAEVRRRYDKAIEIAKRQRKEKKRAIAQQQKWQQQTQSTSVPAYHPPEPPAREVQPPQQDGNVAGKVEEQERESLQQPIAQSRSVPSIDDIILYLQEFKANFEHNYQDRSNLDQLKQENQTLKAENEKLEKHLAKVEKEYETMQEDYQVLMSIMDKARKMVVFDDDTEPSQAFRMDKNGNLEQVAR
ncbi:prespore-specific regulator [Salinibacillus kushneri]|uniref:Prespore-specific regulator n=1 Tax=Salinibacillus kushneri TaxID=237682 RepID=A0A1I0G7F1_9BACI|nr:RsfA family transcriptional regulator [Salinibacillus kushneri]SET66555.1 prespore-specific regulator [Salinibacillus kushneri]